MRATRFRADESGQVADSGGVAEFGLALGDERSTAVGVEVVDGVAVQVDDVGVGRLGGVRQGVHDWIQCIQWGQSKGLR